MRLFASNIKELPRAGGPVSVGLCRDSASYKFKFSLFAVLVNIIIFTGGNVWRGDL